MGGPYLQENSTQSYTIPTGTYVQPGGYVIVARDVDQAAFESYFGVSLGSNVVFLRSSNSVPIINGDETYEILDDGGVTQDGPMSPIQISHASYHRADPENMVWSTIDTTPTPGSGVEAPDAVMSGLVVSEVTDPADYIYEYMELYYDATVSGGNQLPVISGVTLLPAAPSHGDDVTISAQVTDADGSITQVQCWYRFDTGVFTTLAMNLTNGDTYEATIQNVVGDTQLHYYISSADDEPETAYYPSGAPTVYESVDVAGLSAVGDPVPRNPGLDLHATPNPFNPVTTISFKMPAAGHARVEIFDPRGRLQAVVLDEQRAQGPGRVLWNGRDDNGRTLPSGVYLVRAVGAGYTSYTKVMLAK